MIDSERRPLTFSEFTLKEFEKDKEGNWIDEIPDGSDHVKWVATHLTWNGQLRICRSCSFHSIGAVRYAMMDDILRG